MLLPLAQAVEPLGTPHALHDLGDLGIGDLAGLCSEDIVVRIVNALQCRFFRFSQDHRHTRDALLFDSSIDSCMSLLDAVLDLVFSDIGFGGRRLLGKLASAFALAAPGWSAWPAPGTDANKAAARRQLPCWRSCAAAIERCRPTRTARRAACSPARPCASTASNRPPLQVRLAGQLPP